MNNSFDTISAAGSAIVSAENRVSHAAMSQKRSWSSFWNLWCFGSHRQNTRIVHASLTPQRSASRGDATASDNSIQQTTRALPFVAPPSSPASFLPSEPPSATQSPPGTLSLTSISCSMYSPSGPASIFAIGPYANETQLVSPPVFSTYNTEPSTAPFTPPPESVHLTTPSSPEVPFARLLDPDNRYEEAGQRFPLSQYEFQSYQFYPGSPIGQLISPSSGISGSGTSSPFLDFEHAVGGSHFLQVLTGGCPPMLSNFDKLCSHEWGSRLGSGSLTPEAAGPKSRDSFILDRQSSDVGSYMHQESGRTSFTNRTVSFELSADKITESENKTATLTAAVLASLEIMEASKRGDSSQTATCFKSHILEASDDTSEKAIADDKEEQRHQKHPSIGSVKEFNFDSADGGNSDSAIVGSDWWINENVARREVEPVKNWSFPVIQSTVS